MKLVGASLRDVFYLCIEDHRKRRQVRWHLVVQLELLGCVRLEVLENLRHWDVVHVAVRRKRGLHFLENTEIASAPVNHEVRTHKDNRLMTHDNALRVLHKSCSKLVLFSLSLELY